MNRAIAVAGMLVACLIAEPASASTFGTYGGTTNNGTDFDLVSNTTTLYSGLKYTPNAGFTAAEITQLSASYNMTQGAFGGGAPRFSIDDGSGNEAWIYWGTPLGGGSFTNPNANNTWGSTGNYANLLSSDIRVYNNGFGGQNTPNTGETWAQFIAAVGSTDIGFISLDLDSGSFTAPENLLVSDFQVNDAILTATPLPATLPLFAGGLGFVGYLTRRRKNSGKQALVAA